MIASNGGQAVLEGDNWAPIRDTDGTKDYIQVGTRDTVPGNSHTEKHGYPDWADTGGVSWAAVCTIPLSDFPTTEKGFIIKQNTIKRDRTFKSKCGSVENEFVLQR